MARKTKKGSKKASKSDGRRAVAAAAKSQQQEVPTEIGFDFIKGNHFRVITVDGAYGGISPHGRAIHMAIYSERRAIPRRTVHAVSEAGDLGEEIRDKRDASDSFVREIEADLILDLGAAVAMRSTETWRRRSRITGVRKSST